MLLPNNIPVVWNSPSWGTSVQTFLKMTGVDQVGAQPPVPGILSHPRYLDDMNDPLNKREASWEQR